MPRFVVVTPRLQQEVAVLVVPLRGLLLLAAVQRVRALDVGAVRHRAVQLVARKPPVVDPLLVLLLLEPLERADVALARLPLGLSTQP